MLISISELPQGRKVKHIKVDVTFEDDSCAVNTTVDTIKEQVEDKSEVLENKEQIISIDSHEDREYKEIPQEMKDMEF